MGYELWTSPITGYRRTGTRLSELRTAVAGGIQAAAIFEPIQCCQMNAPAEEMKCLLEDQGFDVAGVREKHDGPVIGFVRRERLAGGVIQQYVTQIPTEDLISDSTTIEEILAILGTRPHVFVVAGSGIKGIITRADLNKPPVRVYLFGLVSLLEMHLRFWVRRSYDGESWMGALAGRRVESAKRLLRLRQKHNTDISLLDCLQICDIRDLVVRVEDWRTNLGLGDEAMAKNFLGGVEDLRNCLAHSQHDLIGDLTWQKLIANVGNIKTLVEKSDEIIEAEARASAQAQH